MKALKIKPFLALLVFLLLTSCASFVKERMLTIDVMVANEYRGKVVLNGDADKIYGVTPAKNKGQLIEYKLNLSRFDYHSESKTYIAFYDCQIELVENGEVVGISMGEIAVLSLRKGVESIIECGFDLTFSINRS